MRPAITHVLRIRSVWSLRTLLAQCFDSNEQGQTRTKSGYRRDASCATQPEGFGVHPHPNHHKYVGHLPASGHHKRATPCYVRRFAFVQPRHKQRLGEPRSSSGRGWRCAATHESGSRRLLKRSPLGLFRAAGLASSREGLAPHLFFLRLLPLDLRFHALGELLHCLVFGCQFAGAEQILLGALVILLGLERGGAAEVRFDASVVELQSLSTAADRLLEVILCVRDL
mmetsp:Transcript_50356/g.116249  ORF Transcript_50356/g.116249 Transcript_50356/m.116249 type:complete len:227 (+) Transcript_50356:294-974(+)